MKKAQTQMAVGRSSVGGHAGWTHVMAAALAVLSGAMLCLGGGPQQYWPLGDGAGSLASNAVPGGNVGTLVNYATPNWDTDMPGALAGRSGGSLVFTSANTNSVNGGTLGLAATGGIDGVTLSFWLKPAVIGADTRLFSPLRQNPTAPHPIGAIRLMAEAGHGTLQMHNGAAWMSVTSAGAVRTNQWQHLCLVWLGTQVDAYLNGSRSGGTTSKFEFDRDANNDLVGFGIGAKYLTYGTSYDGKMADLAVWNETLSPARVSRLACGESPLTVLSASDSDLPLYWALDDGTGSIATNSVPGGNSGTLVNFAGAGWDTDVPAALSGRSSGSLMFSSANTNYVNGSYLGISSTGGVDGATVACWLKPGVIVTDMRLWGQLRQTASTPHPVGAVAIKKEANGSGTLQAFHVTSNIWWNITPAGALRTNEWQHLAFAWNGNRLVAYLNGNPAGGMDVKFEFARDVSGYVMRFGLGAKYQTSASSYGYTYDGKMDDVAVWDETLSPERIRQLATGLSPLSIAADKEPEQPEHPLAAYRLDGNAQDSGGRYSGTLAGGPAFVSGAGNTPFGYAGDAALQFDGVNDSMTVPDVAALRPGTNAWTLALWFKADNTNRLGTLIAKRKNAQPYTQMSLMVGGSGTGSVGSGKQIHTFMIGAQTSTDRWEVTSFGEFADGNWHHVALVRGAGDWRPVLYVDGHVTPMLINTDTGARPHNINCTEPWCLGFDGNSNRFTGLIDEVAIWNAALSSENIAWLASNSLASIPAKGTMILVR